MIEFTGRRNYSPHWMKLSLNFELGPDNFKACIFRINGTIYEAPTAEFWEAYHKDRMWSTLTKRKEDIFS